MPNNLLGTGLDLDNSSPTVFADFLTIYDEMAVVRSCMDHKQLAPHTGPSWRRVNYGRVTAASVPDGQDISNAQALVDDPTTISPSDVAVQVILPGSTIRRSGDANLVGNAGEIMGKAYALFEDTQLLTGFSGWTATALGGAGTVMSPGLAAALASMLRIGNSRANPEPWPKPWFLVMHPNSGVALEGRLVPLATSPAGGTAYGVAGGAHVGTSMTVSPDATGRRILSEGVGAVATIAGMTLKYDANIAVDASDDATANAAFGKTGYIYVEEVPAHPAHQTDDQSMRGARELNIWGVFGQGQYRPAASGREVTVDAWNSTS